jgi:4-azaleucine resistance transporter AzlC
MAPLTTAVGGPPSTAQPVSGSEILAALRDSSSVGPAMVSIGLAFGVVVTHAGLAWWWATVFTSTVYAGSFEFLLVGLVAAAVPVATVALTAFLVNVRHVFYALSFPLHRVRGRAARAYSTFALTDEAYALGSGPRARGWSGRRIVCLQLFLQSYWVGGATAGALLGSLVPAGVTGLDFALTALFAVLALDAVRERRGDLATPGLALLCALAARLLVPGELLVTAFALFTVGLLLRRRTADRKGSADV